MLYIDVKATGQAVRARSAKLEKTSFVESRAACKYLLNTLPACNPGLIPEKLRHLNGRLPIEWLDAANQKFAELIEAYPRYAQVYSRVRRILNADCCLCWRPD